MTLSELHKLRTVLVTGKGGVGKTSIAAGMARAAAAAGRRTLAVEVVDDEDRDAPLATALGGRAVDVIAEKGWREEPIRVSTNLHSTVLCPSIGHKAFLRDMLPVRVLADAAMKSQAVRRFLHAAPTFPELGVLYRLLDLSRAKRYDGTPLYEHIIVDLPATGHALALVQVPSTVLRIVGGGAIGGAVRDGIALLCDAQTAGALVVTLPEPLPVSESMELVRGLESSGVAVPGLVVNRAPVNPFGDGELDVALRLAELRPTLGGRSVLRIERARQARLRLETSRPVLFEFEEVEGPAVDAIASRLEKELAE